MRNRMKAFHYVGETLYFDVCFRFNWQEKTEGKVTPNTHTHSSYTLHTLLSLIRFTSITADYPCVLSVLYVTDI